MEKKILEMEILLMKINRLFHTLKPGRINKIDLDLMKDYTKEYYELLLEYESGKDISIIIEEKKTEPEIKAVEVKIVELKKEQELPREEKPVLIKLQEEKVQELKYVKGGEEEEKVVIPKTEKTIQPEKQEEVKNKKPLTKQEDDDGDDNEEKTALGDKLSKGKKTLADKLNANGTLDLRRAIDLNDKFFFIRELFQGDHNAFDTTIKFMNGMTGIEDVKAFVERELSPKYNWNNNPEGVQRFYEVLEEKFGS